MRMLVVDVDAMIPGYMFYQAMNPNSIFDDRLVPDALERCVTVQKNPAPFIYNMLQVTKSHPCKCECKHLCSHNQSNQALRSQQLPAFWQSI